MDEVVNGLHGSELGAAAAATSSFLDRRVRQAHGLTPSIQVLLGKLIRIEANEIRKTGRGAQGVRLIKTDGGDMVTSASLVDPSNAVEEVEVTA